MHATTLRFGAIYARGGKSNENAENAGTSRLGTRHNTYLQPRSTIVIVHELAQTPATGQDLALDDNIFVANLLGGINGLLDGVGRNAEGNVDPALSHDPRRLVLMKIYVAHCPDGRGSGPLQDGGGGSALEEGGGCRREHVSFLCLALVAE